MIRRLLCRLGWHHWKFSDSHTRDGTTVLIYTYAWCDSCDDRPAMFVNVDRVELEPPPPTLVPVAEASNRQEKEPSDAS